MARRFLAGLAGLALVAGGALYALTMPQRLAAAAIAPEGSGDAARGERLFWAGGCASCHASSDRGDAALRLVGGEPLETPVGTFHAPNISPHPQDGIGAWSLADFANAMGRGVAPSGAPYYPAFPYNSYARMTKEDVADLFAFLRTLPAAEGAAPAHELSFPYDVRRGVALWQRAFLDAEEPVVGLPADASDLLRRGQYLVEGPGHCGECHTPRTLWGLGDLDAARWLAGGPSPEGEGSIPNITPSEAGIGDWSQSDIEYYLESGFTPDFDTAGGPMAAVQRNIARLPAEDREAIAAYLKAVPPLGE